jgi:hypothetical protein
MIEEVQALVRQIVEIDPGADPKITAFPSGAIMLDFNARGRKYVFEYLPSQGGFGISRLESATFGWEGVDVSFEDFASAKHYLIGLIDGSVPERG